MISSPQPIVVYRDAGNGSAPLVQTQPSPGTTSASRGIANVAVGRLSYSAGLNYRAGTSDPVNVRNLLTGRSVETTIDIRTIGTIYSLAYQF